MLKTTSNYTYMHITLRKYLLLTTTLLGLLTSCSKKEDYINKIKVVSLSVIGYSVDSLDIKVNDKFLASELLGDIYLTGEQQYNIPLSENMNQRVLFVNHKNGKQYGYFDIDNVAKTQEIKFFYDGRNLLRNDGQYIKPSKGKMGFRISFRSLATKYTGPVDINVYEAYKTKGKVAIDPKVIAKAKCNTNIFSDYFELPATSTPVRWYVISVYKSGTDMKQYAIGQKPKNYVTLVNYKAFEPNKMQFLLIHDTGNETDGVTNFLSSAAEKQY